LDQPAKTELESRATERERAARDWYKANKAAVGAYNELIERDGLFSDGLRKF
jgi:post-segregation antitoxin (ccd killing protein)